MKYIYNILNRFHVFSILPLRCTNSILRCLQPLLPPPYSLFHVVISITLPYIKIHIILICIWVSWMLADIFYYRWTFKINIRSRFWCLVYHILWYFARTFFWKGHILRTAFLTINTLTRVNFFWGIRIMTPDPWVGEPL